MLADDTFARGRELELLLCCARSQLDAVTRARIAELVRADIQWDWLLEQARCHQVAPMLAFHIGRSYPEFCPPWVTVEFQQLAREATIRGIMHSAALVAVVEKLEAAGVRVIAYKGPMMAFGVYGHHGLRAFLDLDVLVPPREFEGAVAGVLEAAGWAPVVDYGFERSFANRSNGICLDVHRELMPPWIPLQMEFDAVWSRRDRVSILGRNLSTFAPTDLLIVLCAQLAKDVGEVGGAPAMIKVCDIAELLRRHPQMNWRVVLSEARRLGAITMVLSGLEVTARLLGAPVPRGLRERAHASPSFDTVIRYMEARILYGRSSTTAQSAPMTERQWHGLIRERVRDRVRPHLSTAMRMARPSEPDFAWVSLPPGLRGLYWIVRPLRLAIKHGSALIGQLGIDSRHRR